MQDRLITDRTIIDVMAFTNCARKVSYMDGDAFAEYASRFIKQYDYIFYISPEGMDIEDNGIRETDAGYRHQIDEEIQKLLLKHRPIVYTLSGTTEKRINQIIEVINF